MTEKPDPIPSKDSKVESRIEDLRQQTLEKLSNPDIKKGIQKNSWEKPEPNIDKTFVVKPPPPKPKQTDTDKK